MSIKISKANFKLKMQKPWHETLLKREFYQKYFKVTTQDVTTV